MNNQKIKLLQINSTYREKSTGRTCFEVEKALTACGHSCITACQFGYEKNNRNNYRINTWLEYYIHNFFGRIIGLCGYGSIFATIRFVFFVKKYSPDIIHLRNLHGFYINLPILFRFLKKYNKPVILSIHDCWIFTGKCPHYTLNKCDRWKSECHNCPRKVVKQYPQSLFFDFSRKMFRDKKKWLSSLRQLRVLGVSNWTKEQAKLSFLKSRSIGKIYNWIDLKTFKPNLENILSNYGLSSNKFTVLFVAVSWNKNTTKYNDLIKIIDSLSEESIQFLIIGSCEIKQNDMLKCVGYISDVNILSSIFSSCDVYVHLSLEDTFGKVVAESLACGTPAIVYDSTALPELVDNDTGIVVSTHNIVEIKNSILEIMKREKKDFSLLCRKRAESLFNYETNVKELLSIYEEEVKNGI